MVTVKKLLTLSGEAVGKQMILSHTPSRDLLVMDEIYTISVVRVMYVRSVKKEQCWLNECVLGMEMNKNKMMAF